MKQLLIKIFFFLFTIVLLDQLFGIGMASVLKNTEKGDWGRNNYIFNEVNHDIVILGSSRAIHHYDPKIFADTLGMSCYNCGEDGMGILLMYARYRAIEARKTPKVVIYEILPEYDLLKETDNLKYLKFLRPYTNNPVIDSLVNRLSKTEKYKLLSGGYRFNSVFVDILAQRYSNASETAKDYTYMPSDQKLGYISQDRLNDLSQANSVHDFAYDDVKLDFLEDLMVRCTKSNTKLFVTASPKFYSTSDSEFLSIKKLCVKYGVPFINHYCDKDYSMNSNLFADIYHLNKNGADIFSSQLASEIKISIKE